MNNKHRIIPITSKIYIPETAKITGISKINQPFGSTLEKSFFNDLGIALSIVLRKNISSFYLFLGYINFQYHFYEYLS